MLSLAVGVLLNLFPDPENARNPAVGVLGVAGDDRPDATADDVPLPPPPPPPPPPLPNERRGAAAFEDEDEDEDVGIDEYK